MLSVIGGTYVENCLHPDGKHLFGSGLRAAVAVSELLDEVHLYTSVSEKERPKLHKYAENQLDGIHLPHTRSGTIEFQYDHSVDVPKLFPDYRDLNPAPPFSLRDPVENALLFSFIEFSSPPKVSANYLVYDPQAGHRAGPYTAIGCNAEHVALVMNVAEARAVARAVGDKRSHSASLSSLGRLLLKAEKVEAIVIKNGPAGAHVVTPDGHVNVAGYKTEHVFGIGTGDIFSAIFAAFWADLREDPMEAARLAAVATAFYSGHSGALPIPSDIEGLTPGLVPIDLKRFDRNGKIKGGRSSVYLAGPFFDLGQRWLINKVFEALKELGLEIWDPASEAGVLRPNSSAEDIQRVAEQDCAAIDKVDAVFAILNGMDPGTLFEIGYAVSRKKPVIVFAERFDPGDLTMIEGMRCDIYQDLASAIYHVAWRAHKL